MIGRDPVLGLLFTIAALVPAGSAAQGTAADYERASTVAERTDGLVLDLPEAPHWISGTRFWYRKSVKGGDVFVLVDAASAVKRPAFDHDRIAAALGKVTGHSYTGTTLPFDRITFVDGEVAIDIAVGGTTWRCALVLSACARHEDAAQGGRGGQTRQGGRGGGGRGAVVEDGGGGGNIAQTLFGGGYYGGEGNRAGDGKPRVSPDGKTEAYIRDANIWTRPVGSTDGTQLSLDGAPGNAYDLRSVSWSPDSQKIAAYRVIPGYKREIHYVESSPADQLQPKTQSRLYSKPGDILDINQPVLFDVAGRKNISVSNALFPNAYTQTALLWRGDSRAVTFEYNQRGHQVFRVIEINAATGTARAIVDEAPKTFFSYSSKRYRYDVNDGGEIIWMSERDGWNHLYLYDGATGTVKNQITNGNWVVRGVDRVDSASRQTWFHASGTYEGQDPYQVHYYRINFDGSGLTALTQADGHHNVALSPDGRYYVDMWSRADLAPVSQLRRASDQSVVMELEHADARPLFAGGIRAPEPFVAKGRDGTTDIYGIIVRPSNFDPKKKYPAIEYIYAGPHDSFVPKTWGVPGGMQAQAELGFIVVQIDGMGTSNRSKAFHDVAWQNIGDAGFPDRILWHKAVAAKYPYYDISRVGIYGGSAGGQSSTGALLFHPEFYKVAVSFAGCHDNRMDKMWWNEQWMGWPIGPQYAQSSNVDHASRLQGKLLLLVGELDENVDPASTFQVANALIKANKTFDLFVFPGGEHGVGRRGRLTYYGNTKQWDYFVHNLLGVEPPNRNVPAATARPSSGDKAGDDDAPHGSLFSGSWQEIDAHWPR
jgi:dipeptidyl aminopeptidase/acylaminoacyl peptidase